MKSETIDKRNDHRVSMGDVLSKTDIFFLILLFIGVCIMEVPRASADPLVVDFAGNITSGTAPLMVEFSNLVTGTQVNCTWGIDNQLINGCGGPTYLFHVPGLYDINLTVTDDTPVTLTETKLDYINVTPADIPVSISFISNTVFGSNPIELTDSNGTIVFVGNTSSRNITPQDGTYKLQIEPGGMTDVLNCPDYGITLVTSYARRNILGILLGGFVVLIIIGLLFGRKA